jgi:hypothetical protein
VFVSVVCTYLSHLVWQVSKDGSGDWVVGGGGGGGVPLAPSDLHYIVSKASKECWDTRGPTALDLWACVPDGHNELFNYSATTGLIITGPRDAAAGKCVKAKASSDMEAFPPTSSIADCDASDENQVFEHTASGQLRLRHNPSVCMTAVRAVKRMMPEQRALGGSGCRRRAQSISFADEILLVSAGTERKQCRGHTVEVCTSVHPRVVI